MKYLINEINNQSTENTPPPIKSIEYQVYAQYMSNIILQFPNSRKLKFLMGTSNAQISFYFMNKKKAINASLYNNFLNQRVVGKKMLYGIKQVKLSLDSFTNSYLSVYTKLRYQLSPTDKAIQQTINLTVASSVKSIIPLWNDWQHQFKPKNVKKLHKTNTNIALIQITDTLNTVWVNSNYFETLKKDPSYPYTHLNNFKKIYNQIPDSITQSIIDLMIKIYMLSGNTGRVTARIANATHVLSAIIKNIQQPTHQNGSSPLAGTSQLVPGLIFTPFSGINIINQLNKKPEISYSNESLINKISSEKLKVNFSPHESIEISSVDFFHFITNDGIKSSIFQEKYAGSSYTVKAIVNNPVLNPKMCCLPLPFDILTNKGWLFTSPVKEAIKNGYPAPTNLTGYVFNSNPNFNFNEGGDFGYINAIVFSQFLELYITFSQCNPIEVKKHFNSHKNSKLSFWGSKTGFMTKSMNFSHKILNETDSKITIKIKPAPPGYLPPSKNNITESLCQLVAIEVIYPFA